MPVEQTNDNKFSNVLLTVCEKDIVYDVTSDNGSGMFLAQYNMQPFFTSMLTINALPMQDCITVGDTLNMLLPIEINDFDISEMLITVSDLVLTDDGKVFAVAAENVHGFSRINEINSAVDPEKLLGCVMSLIDIFEMIDKADLLLRKEYFEFHNQSSGLSDLLLLDLKKGTAALLAYPGLFSDRRNLLTVDEHTISDDSTGYCLERDLWNTTAPPDEEDDDIHIDPLPPHVEDERDVIAEAGDSVNSFVPSLDIMNDAMKLIISVAIETGVFPEEITKSINVKAVKSFDAWRDEFESKFDIMTECPGCGTKNLSSRVICKKCGCPMDEGEYTARFTVQENGASLYDIVLPRKTDLYGCCISPKLPAEPSIKLQYNKEDRKLYITNVGRSPIMVKTENSSGILNPQRSVRLTVGMSIRLSKNIPTELVFTEFEYKSSKKEMISITL